LWKHDHSVASFIVRVIKNVVALYVVRYCLFKLEGLLQQWDESVIQEPYSLQSRGKGQRATRSWIMRRKQERQWREAGDRRERLGDTDFEKG